MEPVIKDENEEGAETDQERTDGEDSATTPSQSRSPSVHPAEDDSVDVFDGYSFKGRHSVIIDADEDGDGEDDDDDDDEDESISGPSLDDILPDELPTSDAAAAPTKTEEVEEVSVPEDVGEPKTPEARPAILPTEQEATAPAPVEKEPEPVTPKDATPAPAPPAAKPDAPRSSQDQAAADASAAAAKAATRTAEDANVRTAPKIRPQKLQRNRREKSGIHALDKDLPDTETEGESGAGERDEDEDDWDFVEAGGLLVEERNGAKGTSLFARGVVDRYKLAVFRKSTPRRPSGATPRSVSGMSIDSDALNGSEAGSPTPAEKRRGRTPGLTFRKHPKQFLKQPPSSRSAKSLAASSTASNTLSAASSSAGLLTPAPSLTAASPSLKSKESALSMGTAPSEAASDTSGNADADTTVRLPASGAEESEKQQKNKVLKKYKEGAEKVLSIFQSPR